MAMAMAYPNTQPEKKRMTSSESEKVSVGWLSVPRYVLRRAPDVASTSRRGRASSNPTVSARLSDCFPSHGSLLFRCTHSLAASPGFGSIRCVLLR
jgi:hypothetical protein